MKRNEKIGNVLSLDPMYSPLHNKIADRYKGRKIAILSSFGLKHYLPDFECLYIETIFKRTNLNVTSVDIELVQQINNHFTSFLKKVEKRKPSSSELAYMTKFYVYLRSFLIDNEIRLVLLHNDLRWQHSIAVMLCKEMNIDYLVTEQGLFRPITTIVDRHGVNANSRVKDEYLSFVGKGEDIKSYYSNEIVNSSHDSLYSYINFFRYLVFSKLGTFLGREARVVHKRHTFSEYIKRFYVHKCTSLFSNKIDLFSEKTNSSSKKLIFVPLQLELDTQFLVHSDFSKIQEVIDLIQQSFTELGLGDNYELVFKLHPNDLNKYSFESYSKITKANIDNNFLENVSLVISVNSSALLQVLSTNTPIITLGRSIYNFENVSIESNKENLVSNIRVQLSENIDMDKRRHYIEYLRFVYSIQGAGNSFSEKQIDRIIDMLDRG